MTARALQDPGGVFVAPGDEADAGALPRERAGLWGVLTTVDHKRLGLRFIVTAFGLFVLGGILAALMRLQLAVPENGLIGPDRYNQMFTMHGTTMMFLFAVPVMEALAL